MVSQGASTMRSLERAIDLLEILETSRSPLRLSEVARRAGLHIATTGRILAVLERRGMVERDESGYQVGVSMLFGAHAYVMSNRMVTAARPVLQELATTTGLTSSLFIRAGWSRVVVCRVGGVRPLRYELPIGERLPLHLGAGRVLAAGMPRDELTELLQGRTPIVTAGGRRITGKQYRAELDEARQRGYGVSRDERVVGMTSVAAPVVDREGTYVAVVQLSARSEDLPEERVEPMSIEVRQAAAAISRHLGVHAVRTVGHVES